MSNLKPLVVYQLTRNRIVSHKKRTANSVVMAKAVKSDKVAMPEHLWDNYIAERF